MDIRSIDNDDLSTKGGFVMTSQAVIYLYPANENQQFLCVRAAKELGLEIRGIWEDDESVHPGAEHRPSRERALEALESNDTLIVHDLQRLSRRPESTTAIAKLLLEKDARVVMASEQSGLLVLRVMGKQGLMMVALMEDLVEVFVESVEGENA
ncbi:recombinase family protein [Plantactinospora solaniradicis]|uniref:Recombinase family protein n=1 Tax=Plantactinospora solaniradicis TaxID=1723736 RepID=A0ABW1KMN7_9ACTN